MKTSEAVKRVREAKGLTQDNFGESIGVNGRRVAQVEAGSGTFRPRSIVKLCETYHKELAALSITPLDFSRVG